MNTIKKRQAAYEDGLIKGKSLLQEGATVSNWRQYWNDSARCLAAAIKLPTEEVVGRGNCVSS